MQSVAARKRQRLAICLIVVGLGTLVGPFLAAVIVPGVAWVAWLARCLPGVLVVSGIMVWYRADKVFDRGFDPDEVDDDDDR